MKKLSLSSRLLWASAGLFIVSFLASMVIFYRGQNRLTIQEMDRLLKSETLTISGLVNTNQYGILEFEFSEQFLPLYEKAKISSFFRFFYMDRRLLKESNNAPAALCDLTQPFRFQRFSDRNYRIHSYEFDVQPEEGHTLPPGVIAPKLCLVVGNDEGPYRELVVNTIYSTIPLLLALLLVSLFLLWMMCKRLTGDLSDLTRALARSDFSSTRSFPKLPRPQTIEVEAIVEKLAAVHLQATQVYEEMLLFMARAAHQLKTPVAAIQATCEVLMRKERSKEELESGIRDVSIGVKQMSQLTLKLISSTRISFESKPELLPIDLSKFFETLWKIFQYQAMKKGIRWEVCDSLPAVVKADEYLLTEVFSNLLENALLYSKEGSKVSVSWKQMGPQMVVTISDQGPGFPKTVRNHLFEPFFRGDERVIGGSGLGLSIVRTAVGTLGGTVELIESGPEGSKIQVVLQAPL